MKIIFVIFFSFLISQIAKADNIKHKRIECDATLSEKRYENIFIIIHHNEIDATIFSANKFKTYKEQYKITKDIHKITFKHATNPLLDYELNRDNGILKRKHLTGYYDYMCNPLIKNFDPEIFLKTEIKKNIKNKTEKNKF